MPAYKRKYSKAYSSRKYAKTGASRYGTSRMLMAARKGARLGYRKSGYKPRAYAATGVGQMTYKYVDTGFVGYNANTTGAVALACTIPQNADETGRLGRNIIMKSITFRGEVFAGSTSTTNTPRLLLVYDRQANKAAPAITDILLATHWAAPRNMENVDRFLILYDKTVSLVGTTASITTPNNQILVQKTIKLKNLITNYAVGIAGTIGEINTGALHFITIGDQPAGTAAAAYNLYTRVRFQDV